MIANRPVMMRELLNELVVHQAGLEPTGNVESALEIAAAVKHLCADCLIIGQETLLQQPELCEALLPQPPYLRIVALSPERNVGTMYRNAGCGPSRPIKCSEEGILQALRASTHYA